MTDHLEKKRNVARKVAEALVGSESDLVGIFLVCSVATGRARPDSDIDLTAITQNRQERRELTLDGEEIDVNFIPRALLDENSSVVEAAWRDQQAKVFSEGMVLYDPTGALTEFQARLQNYGAEERLATFESHMHYARAFLKKARREKEKGAASKAAGWLYQSAMFAWCAAFPLNGIYRNDWLPNLDITKDFENKPEGFDETLSQILSDTASAEALKKKAEKLQGLALIIQEKGKDKFGAG